MFQNERGSSPLFRIRVHSRVHDTSSVDCFQKERPSGIGAIAVKDFASGYYLTKY